jgi:hypothetical protein
LTLDPGWKKFGSGIHIPDPDHWTVFGKGKTKMHRQAKQTGPEGALLIEFAAAVSWNSAFYLWKNAA